MSDLWHGYFGIENLALNEDQRAALVAALRALGPRSDPQPARLCHWRTRPDNDAAIFEAAFTPDTITIAAIKVFLGTIFGINPATITHAVNNVTFDTLPSAVAVFARNGTSYLRMAFFGYDGVTWPSHEQSRLEALAYLKARPEWEAEA